MSLITLTVKTSARRYDNQSIEIMTQYNIFKSIIIIVININYSGLYRKLVKRRKVNEGLELEDKQLYQSVSNYK